MKTTFEIKIGETLVEVKSKRDKDSPSGWSVIAFTPACSIRCIRLHDRDWFNRFRDAIIAAAGGQFASCSHPEEYKQIFDTLGDKIDTICGHEFLTLP